MRKSFFLLITLIASSFFLSACTTEDYSYEEGGVKGVEYLVEEELLAPTLVLTPTRIPTKIPTIVSTRKPMLVPVKKVIVPVVPKIDSSSSDISSSYTCDCSKTCPNMSSCDEAYYQLDTCDCSVRDGDNDGVPCESICGL